MKELLSIATALLLTSSIACLPSQANGKKCTSKTVCSKSAKECKSKTAGKTAVKVKETKESVVKTAK